MNDTFSAKIVKLRGTKSRRELAAAINMTEGAIRSYENGTSPSLEVAQKIASYFDVSLDWLAGREGYTLSSEPIVLDENTRKTIAKAGELIKTISGKSKRILIDPDDLSSVFTELLTYSIQQDANDGEMDNIVDFQFQRNVRR